MSEISKIQSGSGHGASYQVETTSARNKAPQGIPEAAVPAQTESGKGASKSIDELVSDVRERVRTANTEIRFEIDRSAKSVVIKVFDPSTGTVIRQIPSEELQAIRDRLDDLVGVLYEGSV